MAKSVYSVAQNEKAIKDWEEESIWSNWEDYYPSNEEVRYLSSNGGAFEQINQTCHLLIDLYEEEIIQGENLFKALEMLNKIQGSDTLMFAKALRRAIELGTAVSISLVG